MLTLPFQYFGNGVGGFYLPGEGPQWEDGGQSESHHAQGPSKQAGKKCDDRLARIFGDNDAEFATDHDPETLKGKGGKSFSGAGRTRLGDEDPRNGVAHIY